MKIIYLKSREKKPAVFLDRDGVINKDIPGKYIKSVSDIRLYKTALEGLKKISSCDKFHLIIITNQSAVGRGYITERISRKINDKIVKTLEKEKIKINAVYYCPHSPVDNCDCRKPKPGLIKEALKDYKIDLKKSFLIGDKKTDMELALKTGIKSVFVLTGQAKNQIKKHRKIKADYVLKNLKNADKIICR
ncbi:MAG: HAD family hydrolase [Elusimicrobiota bacterium]